MDLSNGYIDAQKSANNGVVVVVVGQLSFPNGGVGKPFVQSFLLSNQVRYSCLHFPVLETVSVTQMCILIVVDALLMFCFDSYLLHRPRLRTT